MKRTSQSELTFSNVPVPRTLWTYTCAVEWLHGTNKSILSYVPLSGDHTALSTCACEAERRQGGLPYMLRLPALLCLPGVHGLLG